MVRMDQYADRKPNQLSGGQQQREALARAIVFRPRVLLLDEPLSNLDAKLRLEMRHEIRRICRELGITTVYVTHDQDEALSLADHVVVMRDGRIVQQGSPRELYERPATRFLAEFLGETNFIPATIERSADGASVLSTPLGTLASAHAASTAVTMRSSTASRPSCAFVFLRARPCNLPRRSTTPTVMLVPPRSMPTASSLRAMEGTIARFRTLPAP
jgi:iron(III) transport system ATP-binding protein